MGPPLGRDARRAERTGELDTAGDAEFPEDLTQVVVDGAGTDKEPGGDLLVSRSPGGQARDLRLLGGVRMRGPGRGHPSTLARGAQLGPGPVTERRHAQGAEQPAGAAQLLAGPAAPTAPPQPLAV